MRMVKHWSPDTSTENKPHKSSATRTLSFPGHAVWNRLAVVAVKPKERGRAWQRCRVSEDAILSANLDGIIRSWNAGADSLNQKYWGNLSKSCIEEGRNALSVVWF
jgi:hypothetical protein